LVRCADCCEKYRIRRILKQIIRIISEVWLKVIYVLGFILHGLFFYLWVFAVGFGILYFLTGI
ncbi:hypothetical protein ACPTI2_13425, partial [Enterococcus faecalis]|uniref:hypothetical protein n=1 Tax=Enterococcus faecalis TaxID=1351 RepID=UPI003CC61480